MAVLYPAYIQAVTIRSGVNDTIVFDEGSGSITATLPAGDYFLRGAGPGAVQLLFSICTAMNAAGTHLYTPAGTYNINSGTTVTIDDNTGTFKLDLANSTFDLADLLGFTSANESLASSQTGANKSRLVWISNQPLAGSETINQSDVVQSITAQGQSYTYVQQDALVLRTLEHELVAAFNTKEVSGGNASFEAWWRRAREGHRFQYHAATQFGGVLNPLSADPIDTFVLGEDACRAFAPGRLSRGLALYSWAMVCRRWVA